MHVFYQPRSQGLFPVLGQGKDSGNEVGVFLDVDWLK